MAMIVISTQYMENYGAHAWDGEGECPQSWRYKGGSEYKILNVDVNADLDAVVRAANVEHSDDYSREYIIGWSVEQDDYLSRFERNQLEFDGRIDFPEPTREYEDVMSAAYCGA